MKVKMKGMIKIISLTWLGAILGIIFCEVLGFKSPYIFFIVAFITYLALGNIFLFWENRKNKN